MASSEDPEKQPLRAEAPQPQYASVEPRSPKGRIPSTNTEGELEEPRNSPRDSTNSDEVEESSKVPVYGATDSVSYNTATLGSLRILLKTGFTVWRRPGLWHMAGTLFLLSFLIAIVVVYVVSDPAALEVSKFAKIGTFLNVFVGLLLGFFMSASMGRWYDCANGFMDLFDAVRTLQMQFYSLGVDEKKMDQILRYGVLSARMLAEELHTKASPTYGPAEVEEMWQRIGRNLVPDDGHFSHVLEEEISVLRSVADPPGTVWTWVCIMLGRMSQDGEIPPMPSPTYGRMMGLAQAGHSGVRLVRSSVNVQPPFIYVQMLAALVHINNLINAISFGLTWGSSIGTTLAMLHVSPPGEHPYDHGAKTGEVARDTQNVIVSFFFSCFGPFIYQALLEVSIAIAQPFSSNDGEIPTHRLLRNLERDLQDGKMISRQRNMPPNWEKPHFKPRVPK